ncbi:apolipoprotein N-acyltransferase [Curvibacter sp. APW13]|uniref:apolipoprotein N-acyltransferase n=1 Tax=Curvibacter sp. APW13 TaxID=3077236 RepID=UPI0028DD7674|nr:apolipoprotein N-acyltransferase [Curvibacter sp. APW13]MDT8989757.1 apolipoprotein N-acyltransferase [Curvibacter sp. APW13]
MSVRLQTVLAVIAGIANACALAWPASWGPAYGAPSWLLQFGAMLVFCILLLRANSLLGSVLLGLAFQATSLCVSLAWLQVSMSQYGGMPSLLAWTAVAALALSLGLYGAMAAGFWFLLVRKGVHGRESLMAALWMLSELARGQWLTGFGWASIGYAHVEGPFAVAAPWVGVYGLGALVVWCAASCASLMLDRKRFIQPMMLAIAVGALNGISPAEFGSATRTLEVELLQGNIAQDEKFDMQTGVVQALRWYGHALQAAQADLVLAPETAIPLLPQQLPADYWQGWAERMEKNPPMRLIGIPLGNAQTGYTNSVVGFRTPAQTEWYRYDKHHLVPFGEFIPPFFRWFVRLMHIPLGDFTRGELAQAPILVQEESVGPAICFEDLFPEELAARFREGQSAPTILANFSNLAWFGDTTAMYQHLHISRMRSMELARPSLRVSNTGVTAVVDHQGKVQSMLPPWTSGVLRATVQGRSGITPFAWWCARWGQAPLWVLGLTVFGLALVQRRLRPQ